MLDFSQLAAQITAFTQGEVDNRDVRRATLAEARRRIQAAGPAWESVQTKLDASRTSWLMPAWREPAQSGFRAPDPLSSYIALATDGSQIVADRHDLALCCLINIGSIVIRYGDDPSAFLHSAPKLAVPDDTLLADDDGDQDPIVPKRLAMHCRLGELEGLATRVTDERARAGAGMPIVGLCDGSLILWPLEGEKPGEYRAGVIKSFEQSLDAFRAARAPIVGYISRPMSKDVINSLRVHVCPYTPADCDRHCPNRRGPKAAAPPCAGTERTTDADLFAALLADGERSAVFSSGSKILKEYAPRNRVAFFYLNTGREVARVEIPGWVAEDQELLDLSHGLCLDQARKGDGYPVALAEAHEQAIVRGAERAAFFHLMERRFVPAGLPAVTTQKQLSKRARRV